MTAGAARPDGDRLVRALGATVFLQWLGASAVIPMLPVFVRHRGGSTALAGVVMAAFFAAGMALQYPAGRLADRIGRRTVLLGGLATYGVASLAFLVPAPPTVAVGLRALQGAGAGAAEVAALALASAAVAANRRGRAFASVYGGQIAGLAVGPLVGSLLGADHMGLVFLGAGVASAAACLPVARVVPAGHPDRSGSGHGTGVAGTSTTSSAALSAAPDLPSPAVAGTRGPARRALAGALLAACVLGLTTGVYETCWTLLLRVRGAADWEIGMSWTLFAIPFVLMTRPSGWLADHTDRRPLALSGLALSTALCAVYPFLHDVPLLVLLGGLEAVGVAVALPATQSLLTQAADPATYGRAQGLFSTGQTGATAVSAAAGGALFSLTPAAPFVTVAGAGLAAIAAAAVTWAPVPGRVARTGRPVTVGS